MLNFLFGQQTGTQELKSLVSQMNVANDKMMQKAKSAEKAGECLYALIQSEAPSFLLFFERIKDVYIKLAMNYEMAAKEQARAIEDLNDIVVRFPILQRIAQERENLKKKYETIHRKYKELKMKAKAQPNRDMSGQLKNCRSDRAVAASALLKATEQYLNYRRRFNKFVQNRSKSAWTRFGESIERSALVEVELMTQLAELCRRLRENADSPKKVVEAVKEAMNDVASNKTENEIVLSDGGEIERPEYDYSDAASDPSKDSESDENGIPNELTEESFKD